MGRENETKRVFGDNPVTRLRPAERDFVGQARMNTFEKLTSLKQSPRQRDCSTIKTTPEAITRDHREITRLRASSEREDLVIYGRPSTPRLRWAGRPWPGFKRNFVHWGDLLITVATAIAVAACLGYVALEVIVPFLRMMVWE